MRILRPLIRKTTKTVVYPLVPAIPVVKSLMMGTRTGNLNRKELSHQTQLLEEQNALLRDEGVPMQRDAAAQARYDAAPTYRDIKAAEKAAKAAAKAAVPRSAPP